MCKWISAICIILGVACLLAAAGFVVYNRWEAKNAGETTQSLLENVQLGIEEQKTNQPSWHEDGDPNGAQSEVHPEDLHPPAQMATIQADGYDCIGILSVPVLDLELPILAEWSYAKLKKAPCHYYGTYYEKDFVIAAHNYEAHFGRLSQLQAGDVVIFTDATGVDHCYEVVLLETLPKEATREMITSGFDLSLYTCTPGGASRVTVRCNAMDQ